MDKVEVAVPEDVGATILTIMRTGGSEGPLHGRFFTVDGTAQAGSDFESINGNVSFENGEMSQTISVPIKDDALKEDMENFMVELLVEDDPSMRSIAFVNIIDNDNNPGVFEFRESQVSVREGSARVSLTIIRTDGTDGSVSLRLRTVDGSARLGEDYTLRSKVISFSDGEREKTVDIDIIDDNIREGPEHFKIGLFDPTNGAILGPNSIFAVTILDDDGEFS
ncbi:G-protein coupled receptor 98 [Araneus ventricosus]|uniref:G-protein coupled receptor 98 n=1 Tax=Araneus ventricosus TaxID=182803 RepID=A0A4Y2IFG0_ARAVE|nr:G-protein coupled receptor 98 [Araneus ventricosus]